MGGGGSVGDKLQGVYDTVLKGQTPQVGMTQAPPDPNAAANQAAISSQQDELKKQRAAQGMNANILTSPQGASAPAPVSRRMLLGS